MIEVAAGAGAAAGLRCAANAGHLRLRTAELAEQMSGALLHTPIARQAESIAPAAEELLCSRSSATQNSSAWPSKMSSSSKNSNQMPSSSNSTSSSCSSTAGRVMSNIATKTSSHHRRRCTPAICCQSRGAHSNGQWLSALVGARYEQWQTWKKVGWLASRARGGAAYAAGRSGADARGEPSEGPQRALDELSTQPPKMVSVLAPWATTSSARWF